MKIWILALVIAAPLTTFAALGDYENAAEKDAQSLRAEHKTSSTNQYRTHEITAATYTAKEYVSDNGIIFAILWRGIAHPDLSILLGSHYAEYQQNFSKLPRIPGNRKTEVKTSKAVISQFGHGSDIRGLAYVVDLVPSHVQVGDLK